MPGQGFQTGRITSIQALRAIAANMVVACHVIGLEARFYPHLQELTVFSDQLGRWGVDCFFVISGFVITKAAMREHWTKFSITRCSRIYPIYWFYLTVTTAFVLFWQHERIDPDQILPSIFLLPFSTEIMPVAWSLVYEIYFYGVVTLIVSLGANLRWAYAAWCVILLSVSIVKPSSFVGDWMALIFIAGGFLAIGPRDFVDRTLLSIKTPVWLQHLGDASYSIYLCHFLVIAGLGRILFWLVPGHLPLSATLCFVSANIAGLASYRWIERPMLKLVRANHYGLPSWNLGKQ